MIIQEFSMKNILDMDSMHDSYATKVKLDNKCLIIVYDRLDEGVLDHDGQPYYKNKKLTIKYEFKSTCEVIFHYKKNKELFIDLTENMDDFIKITHYCLFESYKYSVNSFGELTLEFSIRKIIDGKNYKYKYYGLEINLDPINITYIWE